MAGSPKIIVLSEQLRGQSFELAKDQYTIGRSEDCDICIPVQTVSGRHCLLDRTEDGRYAVKDNNSTNGTRVNGVRIENETVQPLANSDILQVGGVEMFFDCEAVHTSKGPTTQTVINLEDSQTGVPVSDMENFSPFRARGGLRGESRKTMIIMGSIIGVLLAAVLVVLGYLILKLI